MVGPAPAPAKLKLLNGRSPGRDSGGRPVVAPPSFVRVAPKPPTWLSAEAKAEWRRVVPELDRLDVLKPGDRAAVTAYCEAWGRFTKVQRLINSEALVVGERRHPAFGMATEASKELRCWAHELGLTPSAEGRLHVPEASTPAGDFD